MMLVGMTSPGQGLMIKSRVALLDHQVHRRPRRHRYHFHLTGAFELSPESQE